MQGIMIEEARRLGISFIGFQQRTGQLPLPAFNDPQTGSTLLVHEGETIIQALERIRKPFNQ